MKSTKSLSRKQSREIDERAHHVYSMPTILLMENAGAGVARWLAELFQREQAIKIFCGPGNNGGDGYVIARHAQNLGFIDVQAIAVETPSQNSPDALVNYTIALRSGLVTHQLPAALPERCVLVDCLFGTGLTRGISDPYASIVEMINNSQREIVAVDIPSGLDCDSGIPLGGCVRANYTATFVAWKKGFEEDSAKEWIGQVKVIEIGAPKKLLEEYWGETTDLKVTQPR